MLSKEDLKQIRMVVRQEIKEEVSLQLKPIKEEFSLQLDPVKMDISTIKRDVVQIRKDQKSIVNFFDHEYLDLRKRIELIEEHLNLHSKN